MTIITVLLMLVPLMAPVIVHNNPRVPSIRLNSSAARNHPAVLARWSDKIPR